MLTNKYPPVIHFFIGNKIKQLRKEKGLTGEDLARCIGVSQQQVSRYEQGINCVHIDLLAKLSELFKVPIQTFLPSDDI